MRRARKGFTIFEAIASVVLLGVGITAVLGGISSLTKAEYDSRLREHMHSLAVQKFGELSATGQLTQSSSGDFQDQSEPNYEWQTTVSTTGVDSLNHVYLLVRAKNDSAGPVAEVDSLQYVINTTSTGGTN